MTGSNQTWLIAEDDRAIRDILALICELAGIQTIMLPDGHRAASYLAQDRPPDPLPDLALIDIRMPGPWGHELSQQIRRHPLLHDIGIILMTAYELSGADEEAYLAASGADNLLYKPLPDPDTLLGIVESTLASRQNSGE